MIIVIVMLKMIMKQKKRIKLIMNQKKTIKMIRVQI